MNVLTVDFETYYTSTDLGFKTQTTEEYVRDSRFEVIGVSVQINDGEPVWFSGTHAETKQWLMQFDWDNSMALAHNALFDMAILNWHYGIKPKAWTDIMGMSRALYPHQKSHSLKSQAERAYLGEKGDEVVRALGKRYADFTPDDLETYGAYCINDVDLTYALFQSYMAEGFPLQELKLLDLTLRLFIEPKLELDEQDRKSTRLNSSHTDISRMPSSA